MSLSARRFDAQLPDSGIPAAINREFRGARLQPNAANTPFRSIVKIHRWVLEPS